MNLNDIAAEIPHRLRDADDLLHRYGRWAKDRLRLYRCGSAERAYRAPLDDEDRDEQGKPVLMHVDLAMACQRALARVPEKERVVLAILYIPKRKPPELQLRLLRIPPRLSQERHILGLTMFDNRVKSLYSRLPGAAPAHADASWQPLASPKMETPELVS